MPALIPNFPEKKTHWWAAMMPLDWRTVGFMILEGVIVSVPIGYLTRDWRTYSLPTWTENAYFYTVGVSYVLLLIWSLMIVRRRAELRLLGFSTLFWFGVVLWLLFPAVT
jgi:hypothetical protein